MKTKHIPFNIELAKEITNKKIKGRIVTDNGKEVHIICFNMMGYYPIVCSVMIIDGKEFLCTYDENGCYHKSYKSPLDLKIEIPTYYKDYSNFKPCKLQPCLVRDYKNNKWIIQVCAGKDNKGNVLFYTQFGTILSYQYYIPLCKATKQLVGTTKGFDELDKE